MVSFCLASCEELKGQLDEKKMILLGKVHAVHSNVAVGEEIGLW